MEGKKMGLHMITFILLIVGGLNWLIWALFKTDIGAWIGGMDTIQAKIVYILVGLSAIYELAMHKKCCKLCGNDGMASSAGGMNKPSGTGMGV